MTTSGVPDSGPVEPGPGERILRGDAATRALGRLLAETLPERGRADGAVLCLSGQLGAGKTTLVKGLAEGLGVADERDVTSPTFLRLVRYEGTPDLVHVDAYRMGGSADVQDLGLHEDLAGGAVVAVEWPEMIEEALPDDRLTVELGHRATGARSARITAGGPLSRVWLAALERRLGP